MIILSCIQNMLVMYDNMYWEAYEFNCLVAFLQKMENIKNNIKRRPAQTKSYIKKFCVYRIRSKEEVLEIICVNHHNGWM